MNAIMNTTILPIRNAPKVIYLDIHPKTQLPVSIKKVHQLQIIKALISCFIERCQHKKIKYEFNYKMEVARLLLRLHEQLQKRNTSCSVEMIRALFVVQQQFELLSAILGWDFSQEFKLMNELKHQLIYQCREE